MTCIVSDCPDLDGCMFIQCGTPCKDPGHRLEWEATVWVKCTRYPETCDNETCYHALPHHPLNVETRREQKLCIDLGLCEWLKLHRGLKGRDRQCQCVPIQPCGHPMSAIVGTDEGTNYCAMCEKGDGDAVT